MKKIIVLSGPTASGKSQLADTILHRFPSNIINADALQVYNALPILTAQPSNNFDSSYKLYSFLDIQDKCSAALWLNYAKDEITKSHADNKLPIIVGGTGLYLKTLLYGLSEIPEISIKTKQSVQAKINDLGFERFYQELSTSDQFIASLHKNDQYRIIRAAEVLRQTGRSMNKFHQQNQSILYDCLHIHLNPDRDTLYSACNNRFVNMLIAGAVEEVREFNHKKSNEVYQVEKAIGYQQITDFLSGALTMIEATELTQQLTRNYAKRQYTWFRHQMLDKQIISFVNYTEVENEAISMIKHFI